MYRHTAPWIQFTRLAIVERFVFTAMKIYTLLCKIVLLQPDDDSRGKGPGPNQYQYIPGPPGPQVCLEYIFTSY